MTRDGDPGSDPGSDPGVHAGEDMVFVLDSERVCSFANDAFLEAFARQRAEVVGQRADDPLGRQSFAGLVEGCLETALEGEPVRSAQWWDFPALGFRYVSIALTPNRDESGAIHAVTVCVRDHTDAQLAQEAAQESERRFEDFAAMIDEWLWELDAELRFVYLSPRFEAIMGIPREQVLGRRRIEVFPGEDHAIEPARHHHRDLARRRAFDDYRFTSVLEDGSKRIIRMSGVPVFDARERFLGYRGTARDESAQQDLQSRMAHLASHDALTGLINRQAFLQRLQRVLDTASAEESEHGLCYVDVDRFRAINDRWGHPAGDLLLEELAELLRRQIRRRDTLARVGGNAFAVLMEHCSLAQIERVAESIQRAVREFRFERMDETIGFTVTIGVVPIDADTRSLDRVLRSADRACYAAKSAGGDRVLVYGRRDREAARERRGRDFAPADT
ncbi:MAG: diguanylate cyclase [Gammaproteobacteria bacterium]|nr:diguanylate cyclase [Gammaproteobacteria bacterium]NIP89367.1 diguanylate cyclase [Gammaproteobacteria bacterium]NIR24201.1 diguanylate cyclase [Gammaproteobacteria bacterium]NIS05870.1 diguanylate cyclase [Gammaproteobacteria bacterium]NIU41109.1 diguanylate cyclase [Gammaproteobacteria bacterium]